MSIFGRQSIRSRVMKSISDKLDSLDREHDEVCKAIDDQAELDKTVAGDKMVESITKKFI